MFRGLFRLNLNLLLAVSLTLPMPTSAATGSAQSPQLPTTNTVQSLAGTAYELPAAFNRPFDNNFKIDPVNIVVTHQVIPMRIGEKKDVATKLELTSWFFYPETEEQVAELVRRMQSMMGQLDQNAQPFTVLTVTDKADVRTTDDVPGSLTRGLSEKFKQLNRLVHVTKEYKDKIANGLKSMVSKTINASLSLVPDEYKIGLKMFGEDLIKTSEKIANGSLYKHRLPIFSITRGVVNGSWAIHHFVTGYATVGIPYFIMIDTGLSPYFSHFPIMSMGTAVGLALGVASATMSYEKKRYLPWISTPGPFSNTIGNYLLNMSYDFMTEDIPGTNDYENLPGKIRLKIDRKLYEAFSYEAHNMRVRNIALNSSLTALETGFYGGSVALMALGGYAMATAPDTGPLATVAISLAGGLLGQLFSDKAVAKFDTLNRLKHAAAVFKGLGEEDLRRFKHTEVWSAVLQAASSIAPTAATIATLGGNPTPGRILLGTLFVTGLIADRIAGGAITRFILGNPEVPDCVRFLKGEKPLTEPPEK